MFQRIFGAALIAGLAAGILTAALQFVTTTPLIVAAEVFEGTAAAHSHAAAASPGLPVVVDPGLTATEEAWAPHGWLQRTAATSLMTIIISVGLALVLVALMALKGEDVDWKRGLAWGTGGFAAFSLLPAAGLPPELPGMLADDVGVRQNWWAACVLASAFGVWLIAFSRGHWLAGLGLILLVAPHLYRPLHPAAANTIPAELAAQFVATSLAVAAVSWCLIGSIAGHFFGRWRSD